jgi:bis(5'-adenosyl)-triphosphatase
VRNPDCPFCSPSIAATTFAETEVCRAIYNRAPLVPGHSLVIPKRHVTRLQDLGADEMAELSGMVQRMSAVLLAAYGCDGCDLSVQQGASAGQTVDHLHIHLVPRRAGDLPHDDWHAQLLDSATRPVLTQDGMAREVVRLRALVAAIPRRSP